MKIYSKEKTCFRCAKVCKSILAIQRANGNNSFDQLRHEYNFRSGQDITFVREGRIGFYCIQSGYIRLSYQPHKTSRTVRISGPSHLVGTLSGVSDRYFATAISPVSACFFDLEIFLMLMSRAQGMTMDIIKLLCNLIIIRDDQIAALGSKNAASKIASTLFSLGKNFGQENSDGSLDIIPTIDRSTLAELSGTAVETFSRVIGDLEKNGIIARNKRAIKILNLNNLRECIDK